ncbi:MAG TPA: hypothetical protein PK373_07315, partial [Sedimentisphaerales bacterium]|nr:hypothetical protein [Sedimentisphaerales bacterium]
VGYRISPSSQAVQFAGPWVGNLSNRGGRVVLEKSLPKGNAAEPTAWVVVDEVIYSDVTPWPPGADGDGQALHRITTAAGHSGNDPRNWRTAAPTPGK